MKKNISITIDFDLYNGILKLAEIEDRNVSYIIYKYMKKVID